MSTGLSTAPGAVDAMPKYATRPAPPSAYANTRVATVTDRVDTSEANQAMPRARIPGWPKALRHQPLMPETQPCRDSSGARLDRWCCGCAHNPWFYVDLCLDVLETRRVLDRSNLREKT